MTPPRKLPLGTETVVLLAATPAGCHVLSFSLRQKGHEVLCCTTAAALSQLVRGAIPSCLVVMESCPQGDAMEVCRLIRSLGARIPVIVLHSAKPLDQRVDLLEAGADHVADGPLSTPALCRLIELLTHRQRRIALT